MRQKSLLLIVAQDLVDKLASAGFVVDADGRLVYFNEAAEDILGRSFGEIGPRTVEEWAPMFEPTDPDGRPLPADELPLVLALRARRPVHRTFTIRGLDGAARTLEATALPLFSRPDALQGALALFWEREDSVAGPGSA